MTEKSGSSGSSAVATRGTGNSADASGSGTPLQTERGNTTIADAVVTKVAGIAAREVRGVHDLGGGVTRALGSVTQRVGIGDERSQGVSVEVGETQAAVDIDLVVEYGAAIVDLAAAIRRNVVTAVERMTGLQVVEVNVTVNDVHLPGDDADEKAAPAVARVA